METQRTAETLDIAKLMKNAEHSDLPLAGMLLEALPRKLYIAMELSDTKWLVRMGDGYQNPSNYTVASGDIKTLQENMRRAMVRLKLPEDCQKLCCYEAGRDGFWIHRALEGIDIATLIVDSASIEVDRRKRRAKTDGMDVDKLYVRLVRYDRGQTDIWRIVEVPTVEAEDARRPHRELERLQKEATQHKNRIRSLLKLHGISVGRIGGRGWEAALAAVRCHDGSELPPHLKAELDRETQRLALVNAHIHTLEVERGQALAQAAATEPIDPKDPLQQILTLMELKGIGERSAWLFVMEIFGWRTFASGKQVGNYAGMTGTPYDSGASQREQGINKAGNHRVRRMVMEIAWGWVRYQPNSELTQWYLRRFAGGGARLRKVGIVALGRKLLVALWRYLDQGVAPHGAEFKGKQVA